MVLEVAAAVVVAVVAAAAAEAAAPSSGPISACVPGADSLVRGGQIPPA